MNPTYHSMHPNYDPRNPRKPVASDDVDLNEHLWDTDTGVRAGARDPLADLRRFADDEEPEVVRHRAAPPPPPTADEPRQRGGNARNRRKINRLEQRFDRQLDRAEDRADDLHDENREINRELRQHALRGAGQGQGGQQALPPPNQALVVRDPRLDQFVWEREQAEQRAREAEERRREDRARIDNLEAASRQPRSRVGLWIAIISMIAAVVIFCIIGFFMSLLQSKDMDSRLEKNEAQTAGLDTRVGKTENDVVNLALGVNDAVSDLRVADAKQEARIMMVETSQKEIKATARARAKSVDEVLAKFSGRQDVVERQLTDTGGSLSRLSNMTARIQEVEARAARLDTISQGHGRQIGAHDRLHPRTITAVPVNP